MRLNIKNFLITSVIVLFISCTKYVPNNNNNSSSGSNASGNSGSGATPLGNGGSGSGSSGSGSSGSGSSGNGSSGSGSSGSGSSGSGSTGSGSTGTGSGGAGQSGSGSSSSGTINNPPPNTYLQLFDYTGYSSDPSYQFYSDSIKLFKDYSYTTVKSGNVKIWSSYGNNTTSLGQFNLNPASYYSTIFYFKNGAYGGGMDGTVLFNNELTLKETKAYLRFINIDASTTNSFHNFSFKTNVDSLISTNRKYLDHKSDSSLANFKEISAIAGVITIKNSSNQMISQYPYTFDARKKYTVFSFNEASTNTNKIVIARHN